MSENKALKSQKIHIQLISEKQIVKISDSILKNENPDEWYIKGRKQKLINQI